MRPFAAMFPQLYRIGPVQSDDGPHRQYTFHKTADRAVHRDDAFFGEKLAAAGKGPPVHRRPSIEQKR